MTSLLGHQIPGQPLLSDAEKLHYEHVINVFEDEFKPYSNTNFGSIDNRKLQQAVAQVYQAMTAQERQQY